MKNTSDKEAIVIAIGMAERQKGENFNDVFHRADQEMYANKEALKKKRPSIVLR